MKWFQIDSPLFQTLNTISDVILLNLYFLVTVIFTLGIGLGSGVTALIYAIYHGFRRHEGKMRQAYVKSFKANFKSITPYSLLIMALIFIIQWVPNYLELMSSQFYQAIQYFITTELILQFLYVCAQQSKIKLSIKDSIKNSFLLIHRHLLTTLIVLVSLIICLASLYVLKGLSVLFVFAVSAFVLEYFVLEKLLIAHYMPETMANQLKIQKLQ